MNIISNFNFFNSKEWNQSNVIFLIENNTKIKPFFKNLEWESETNEEENIVKLFYNNIENIF